MTEIRDGLLTQSHGWYHKVQSYEKAPIYIDDAGQLDIIELSTKARRLKETRHPIYRNRLPPLERWLVLKAVSKKLLKFEVV